MNNQNGIIYIAINLKNGKRYVGCTKHTLEHRIKTHLYDLNRGKKYAFNQALKHYGLSCFVFITIPVSLSKIDRYEKLAIRILKTKSHENGYNICDGGRGVKDYTGEIRKKISINHADVRGEKNPNFGNHQLAGKNSINFGKHPTKETIQKMKKPHPSIQGKNHYKARKVILISPQGEKYELPCYHPFCNENNLNPNCIRLVLQGKQNNHQGWTGRYLKK